MNRFDVRIASILSSLLAMALTAGSASAQAIVRGPYLQQGASTSVIIRWQTDTDVTTDVEYGTTLSALSRGSSESAPSRDHEVLLSSLQPGTRYYYRITLKDGRVLAGGDDTHYFVTTPAGGDEPFRVWVIGDSGTSGRLPSGLDFRQVSVRDEFLKRHPVGAFQFLIMLGDNAYDTGTDTEYQRAVFTPYDKILRSTVVWPTQGNHDETSNAYYPVFSLPKRGESGGVPSGTEHYYSFNYGNAHFISLNSEISHPSFRDEMLSWLRQDLLENKAEWTVAFWHHPPYSKGSHNSDSPTASQGRLVWMREHVVPVLESSGVDLVLTGHSHSYERTALINGHYGFSSTFSSTNVVDSGERVEGKESYLKAQSGKTPNSGTVYVGAGNGGQLHRGQLNHPAMVRSLEKLGSMSLSFDGNVVEGVMIGADGAIEDQFSIRKDPRRPRDVKNVSVSLDASTCGVEVNWSATEHDVSYDVYRSSSPDSRGQIIGHVSGPQSSFKDSFKGVAAGDVAYSVRAKNSAGLGPWGSAVRVSLPSTAKCS
jgi:hypothetical protein